MAGLRPYQLNPINRGCINTLAFNFVNEKNEPVDKSGKKLYLTAKTQPWDDDADDSDAVFKVIGTTTAEEPNRVKFELTEAQSYLDPDTTYYCDVVETDLDGTSNANRLFIGQFNVIGGANNAQAGGI